MDPSSSYHNDDLIPDREILLHASHTNCQTGSAELNLIPEPSDQSDDPINWSKAWKTTVIVNQAIFVFISILTPLAIAPLSPIFEEEFHKNLPQVNMLFGAAAMALGYANLIIVPASNIFGRRPVTLICGLICVLATIWQARVTSYSSFIAARVIGGIGAAANETIMPMVISDVMFLHQRGLWMGLYFWAYFIRVNLGPVISGNIAANGSWRWFFWVCAILQAVAAYYSLIIVIFMFPETRYIRTTTKTSEFDLTSSPPSEKGTPVRTHDASDIDNDKISTIATHMPSFAQSLLPFPRISGRPTKRQFSLIQTPFYPNHSLIVRDIFAPLQIFTLPIIFWTTFSFCFAANCILALNLTQSQVFAALPYDFNPGQVGYVNFAFVVGGIIGLLTAGPFSDWVALRGARKNGGLREAEMRLWSLIPYVAAVGYQRHWPWEAIVVIGYGFVGIEVVFIPAILISYAVDCYKHIPGQIMVSATIVKNTFGFGMIFFFNDWAVSAGYIPPVLTIMALTIGITLFGMVLFLVAGKRFRRASMGSKVHEL